MPEPPTNPAQASNSQCFCVPSFHPGGDSPVKTRPLHRPCRLCFSQCAQWAPSHSLRPERQVPQRQPLGEHPGSNCPSAAGRHPSGLLCCSGGCGLEALSSLPLSVRPLGAGPVCSSRLCRQPHAHPVHMHEPCPRESLPAWGLTLLSLGEPGPHWPPTSILPSSSGGHLPP